MNKLVDDALHLPLVINLNPRSVYNKVEEFKTMIEQMECGLCFISESWDRADKSLEDIIQMENFAFIKNTKQRSGQGGKPAIFVSTKDYFVKELGVDVIAVSPNVEAVWALLTPKSGGCRSKIKNIAACSYYYTKNTNRSEFLDHITEAYHIISAKYGPGTHFIIAGDSNRLQLNPILNISPSLKQVVTIPTRKDPDAILDTIITSLWPYYHPPSSLPPLDNDESALGAPSDHLIIYMKPISSSHPKVRNTKTVTFRPLTESGLESFGNWIISQNWENVYGAISAHEKAEKLQNMLIAALNKYLPEKSHRITSDDQPWFGPKLKKLDRKLKREYSKNKKSSKWMSLREEFLELCSVEKVKYYQNIVEDLKVSNPGQWYSKLKRMSSHDAAKSDEPVVQSINSLPNQIQAEMIADEFSAISNMYDKLNKDDISEKANDNNLPIPNMTPYFVHQQIKKLKNGKSTLKGDIPTKVVKLFGYELSFPLSNIFNRCCKAGEYPNIWKLEMITPIPKQYPTEAPKHLRKISGTLIFSKLFEKFLSKALVSDMLPHSDPSQYGNRQGTSTQHYLIKLIHQILTSLDKNTVNEAYAAVVHFIDWQQAFDRQCPKLAIDSFIKNGVRNSLIPVLTNYFQERQMQVKWHGEISSIRDMPGGGPQGCILGQISFSSQSNDSGEFVPDDKRFKFVDDLSLLEIINLILAGLQQYDVYQHVPSDIAVESMFLPNQNCESQNMLNKIAEWTVSNKMKLNEQKSKYMVVNYTRKYQFSARFTLNGSTLEAVEKMKVLGTIISSDLS